MYITHVSINYGHSWPVSSDWYPDRINELKTLATEGVHQLVDSRHPQSMYPWFVKWNSSLEMVGEDIQATPESSWCMNGVMGRLAAYKSRRSGGLWHLKCGRIRASSGAVNFSIIKSNDPVYRGWVVWGQNAAEKMWRKTLKEYKKIEKISRDAPILPRQLPWLVTIEDDSAGNGSLWADKFAGALAFSILQNAGVAKTYLK